MFERMRWYVRSIHTLPNTTWTAGHFSGFGFFFQVKLPFEKKYSGEIQRKTEKLQLRPSRFCLCSAFLRVIAETAKSLSSHSFLDVIMKQHLTLFSDFIVKKQKNKQKNSSNRGPANTMQLHQWDTVINHEGTQILYLLIISVKSLLCLKVILR